MNIKPEMSVQHWPLSKIKEYEGNPRKNDHAVDQTAAAIKEFGFRVPVIAKSDGTMIDGHLRLKAARKLGLKTIPVVLADDLTEAQIKAFRISVNQIANIADWDFDLLRIELGELESLDFDLGVIGFDVGELTDLMFEETEGLTDEDAVPSAPAQPVTIEGDVWLLGRHRLLCGDSTSIDAVQRLCEGQLVDLWITDPPYNVNYVGGTSKALTIQNDDMSDENFRQFLTDAYTAADASMKAGAVFYIWHADSQGYNFRGAAHDMGWQIRQCLIWKKQSMVMGRQDYHWKHEPCLYGWKGGAGHLWATDRKQTTILEFDRPSKNIEHPTMKPVQLFEYQVMNNTKGSDIVLDSFAGSGTTAIVCEKSGRIARLMELDPKYCDVIINRWQEYTDQTATLASTGDTYDNLKAERCNAAA